MNDVALVALISSGSTVLVALAGLASTLFGEQWREAQRQKATNARESAAARDEALRTFAGSLLDATQMVDRNDRITVHAYRVRFTATLGAGEGNVAEFAKEVIYRIEEAPMLDRMSIAVEGVDKLLEWHRGERAPRDLGFDNDQPNH